MTSEQFAADLAAEGIRVDATNLAKVYVLTAIENLTWGGSFDIDGRFGKWEINLRRNIRPFRRVKTLADYLATRKRVDAAAAEEGLREVGALTGDTAASPGVGGERRFVFIAMPFGAPWSEAVHTLISRACESLDAEGLTLHWQRADEIARPGKITEQIIDAITACDAMVADLSGLNANVIYELGFAHANSTPVVLLSQNPDASPFDLRDMRQIRYSVERLDDCVAQLILQLRAALSEDGTGQTGDQAPSGGSTRRS